MQYHNKPISLLRVNFRLYEKILLKRLKPIVEKNEVIPVYQFEFKESHFTND